MRKTTRKTSLIRAALPVAAFGLVLLTGCTSGAGSASSTDGGSGQAHVATVPGGPNPYFDSWGDAITQAGEDFDIAEVVNEVPPSITFSLDVQNSTINALAGRGFNAFAIFPDDASGSNTQMQQLADRGIPSISVAGCTNDPTPALFCLATDVKQGSYESTKYAIDKMGGKGTLAFLTGFLTDPNTQLRIQGAEQAVAETNGAVTLVQTITDVDTPDAARPAVENLLSAQGSTLGGIVAQSYYAAEGVAAVMLDQPQYRNIVTVLEDDSPSVMKALGEGAITATMWQNPYGQAYLAGYILNKIVAEGCTVASDAPFLSTTQTSKFVNSGFAIIDSENYDEYKDGPYSVPTETEKVKQNLDENILSCD